MALKHTQHQLCPHGHVMCLHPWSFWYLPLQNHEGDAQKSQITPEMGRGTTQSARPTPYRFWHLGHGLVVMAAMRSIKLDSELDST